MNKQPFFRPVFQINFDQFIDDFFPGFGGLADLLEFLIQKLIAFAEIDDLINFRKEKLHELLK